MSGASGSAMTATEEEGDPEGAAVATTALEGATATLGAEEGDAKDVAREDGGPGDGDPAEQAATANNEAIRTERLTREGLQQTGGAEKERVAPGIAVDHDKFRRPEPGSRSPRGPNRSLTESTSRP